MSLSFLPAIVEPRFEQATNGIDLKTISYLGGVFTRVESQNVGDAGEFLRKTATDFGALFAVHFDVTSVSSIEDVLHLLDAGAAKAFVSFAQLEHLSQLGSVGWERLVLMVTSRELESRERILEAFGSTCAAVYVEDVALLNSWLLDGGSDRSPVYVLAPLQSQEPERIVSDWIKQSVIPIIPASRLSLDPDARDSHLIQVGSVLQVTSDRPDGLLSTIVTDERGVALGLVFSSTQSIQQSLKTGRGVYQSRKRGLWYKGESSGDIQELIRIQVDCDRDCLRFVVRQKGRGFCHRGTATCFEQYHGLSRLQQTLQDRKTSAPPESYTSRLFSSPDLLRAKIMEEAEELCNAKTRQDVAFEAADLIYFALTKCIAAGVNLEDVESNLDAKSLKVKRRKGDAKVPLPEDGPVTNGQAKSGERKSPDASAVDTIVDKSGQPESRIRMKCYDVSQVSPQTVREALQRPSQRSTDTIMEIVKPIIKAVRERGDAAVLEYTHRFEKATSLTSPVLRAPFPASLFSLPKETIAAIDVSFDNIYKFHAAQKEEAPLEVETMPGVVCSRFSRPIERVGLYIPGGTAVLPSTALMLGVPALVSGCKKIVLASPPRPDGSITPEIVYIAHKIGAESIVLAGGAQAVAALAYGTESVSKVDKILGPGNQFVTAAKMMVSNDTSAGVSIDMPAGPSEVLVVADETANPAFVASDLLSQAEHGTDSQVVLIGVNLTDAKLSAIEDELHRQATALPRVGLVRGAIDHSVTLRVKDLDEAMVLSNTYAPEHLILQVRNAQEALGMVENAGSVFVGPWTPESVGDYSAGVNHSLPTYGYAKQYSGVNLASYVKHITSSCLTADGLRNVGTAVMQMAKVEELEAHRRAVSIRLEELDRQEASGVFSSPSTSS